MTGIERHLRQCVAAVLAVSVGLFGAFLLTEFAGSDKTIHLKSPAGSFPAAEAAAQAAAVTSHSAPPDTQRRAVRRIYKQGLPVFCGGRRRYAAITFDDGPGPYTGKVLRLLRHRGLAATFFVVGSNVSDSPGAVAAESKLGSVGNHSWSHPPLTALPARRIHRELIYTNAVIRHATGESTRLMRPPYGLRNPKTLKEVHRAGLVEVLWSADSEDALGANARQIAKHTLDGLGPGAIILMHENRGQTLLALHRYIIPRLRKRHISLVTVPELLALNPPSLRQLRAGPRGCRQAGKVNVSGYFFRNHAGVKRAGD